MTCRILAPARLHGSVQAPPAKAEALRALLLAALGRGPCRIHGLAPPLCQAVEAMTGSLAALGARVCRDGDALRVDPAPVGPASREEAPYHSSVLMEALPLLIPALWARERQAVLTLKDGPDASLLEALEKLSRRVGTSMTLSPASPERPAVIEVRGKLNAGDYEVEDFLSVGLASGLLIALSHATDEQGKAAPSRLTVAGSMACRSQVNMTLEWMRRFGRCYQEERAGVFVLEPAQGHYPEDVRVPGDWAQGAALLCANALGSGVVVENLREGKEKTSLQGEARILDLLGQMGLLVFESWEELYVTSPSRARLLPLNAGCRDMMDLVPILALLCTQACGESTLSGMGGLGQGEEELLAATAELLTRMGAQARLSDQGDALILQGPTRLRGGFQAEIRGDHRMALLLALAALIAQEPITVSGMEILGESWPGFLEAYQALGGKVS